MDDCPQSPPPTDAPNAGDPTGPLRIGNIIIEGVDRVSVELSDHVIVFYNELITLMNAAGPSWQLIWKERYDQIKEVLIRIRDREAVSHVRRDHPQCYKWSSLYALMNDGEGGFIVVVHPKYVAGFEPLQEDADINTVLRLSYLEKAYADIKHHHGADHCKDNTLLARIGQSIHNIGRVCTKLFTRTCPICIQREMRLRYTPGIIPIVTRGLGTRGQVDLIDFQLMPSGDFRFLLNYLDHGVKFLFGIPLKRK